MSFFDDFVNLGNIPGRKVVQQPQQSQPEPQQNQQDIMQIHDQSAGDLLDVSSAGDYLANTEVIGKKFEGLFTGIRRGRPVGSTKRIR